MWTLLTILSLLTIWTIESTIRVFIMNDRPDSVRFGSVSGFGGRVGGMGWGGREGEWTSRYANNSISRSIIPTHFPSIYRDKARYSKQISVLPTKAPCSSYLIVICWNGSMRIQITTRSIRGARFVFFMEDEMREVEKWSIERFLIDISSLIFVGTYRQTTNARNIYLRSI